MKKIFLISAILLLFAGFTMAETTSFTLYKGWNMIADGMAVARSENPCADKIIAVYYYSPLDSGYLGGSIKEGTPVGWTNNLFDKYRNYENTHIIPTKAGTGFWAYSLESCSLKINPAGNSIGKKLFTGWNFVTITSDMLGLSSKNVFSQCQITNLNFWNPIEQQWVFGTGPGKQRTVQSAINEYFYSTKTVAENNVGLTWLIKVSDVCQLSSTIPVSPPPTLPNQDCTENWTCTNWLTCNNNTQTRTCTDTSNCGTTLNKPSISRACTSSTTCQTQYIIPMEAQCNGNTLQEKWQNSDCSTVWKDSIVCPANQRCYVNGTNSGCQVASCSEMNGYICTSGTYCQNNNTTVSSDSSACCLSSCVTQAELSCTARNGQICPSSQICSTPVFRAADTASCCGSYCTASNTCDATTARAIADNDLQSNSYWGNFTNISYKSTDNSNYWTAFTYCAKENGSNNKYMLTISVYMNQSQQCVVSARSSIANDLYI